MDQDGLRASVTFIGNATNLLRLGDFTLLTDPNFVPAGSRVHLGYGMWTRRVADPARTIAQLPPFDGVLLSHFHGDHWDRLATSELPKTTPVLTTPQPPRAPPRRKFSDVRGLPTWETQEMSRGRQRLRVTSVPGRHGPGLMNQLLPDVMGSVVELEEDGRLRLRLYITGDTLYRPFLEEVPRRCGEIDAMIIHLGGTKILGMLLTMDDRQGVATTELIRPRVTIPVHNDDYVVQKMPLSAFLDRARERGLSGIRPINRGDCLELPLR
jgi:L-ascorbate metabolism protein UlaG (beta-lactamase superfamily)